jgi:hypothetical protein
MAKHYVGDRCTNDAKGWDQLCSPCWYALCPCPTPSPHHSTLLYTLTPQLLLLSFFDIEFTWVKMEPSEGEFNFTWLDSALSVLAKYNISAVLGTPTAAPPAWLIAKYPEIQVGIYFILFLPLFFLLTVLLSLIIFL